MIRNVIRRYIAGGITFDFPANKRSLETKRNEVETDYADLPSATPKFERQETDEESDSTEESNESSESDEESNQAAEESLEEQDKQSNGDASNASATSDDDSDEPPGGGDGQGGGVLGLLAGLSGGVSNLPYVNALPKTTSAANGINIYIYLFSYRNFSDFGR